MPRGGHNDKYDTAYFGWIKFELEKSKVPELQKELKLNQDILRFILFKTVKEDTRANIDINPPELKENSKEQELINNDLNLALDKEQEGSKSKSELDRQIESITE